MKLNISCRLKNKRGSILKGGKIQRKVFVRNEGFQQE
jgi:hypothetical protein